MKLLVGICMLDCKCVSVNALMSEGGTVTVRTLEQVEWLKKWLEKEK